MTLSELTPEIEHALGEVQPALVRFFAAHGVTDRHARDDLVSRVNLRVVERLVSRSDVDDVRKFAMGVSKNVLQEHWRELKRSRIAEATLTSTVENLGKELSTTIDTGPHTRQSLLGALRECLVSLSEEDRAIAERCYGEGRSKDNREQLASTLGISRNALDARISRLRTRLELCVRQRLAGRA